MKFPIADQSILVTGGAGFVGSHLVDALAPHNDVRVLDNFSSGSREHLPAGVTVVEGDLRDPLAIQRGARGVDLIYHQGAVVSVTESVAAPRRTNAINLGATLDVLEQARIEDARVVLASSAAVYGDPESVPIPESATGDPPSPYGIQKLTGDAYARRYHDLYGLDTVCLRYFNIYGPRQQGPYSGVISTFLEQARAGEPITVEGDGEQTRDFVHVADVVRANLRAGVTETTGSAFNVGTGRETSIRSLAERIRRIVGRNVPIVHTDPRPGDIRHSCAETSRARTEIGFESAVDLERGLETLVEPATGDVIDAMIGEQVVEDEG